MRWRNTKHVCKMSPKQDCFSLQEDFNNLAHWVADWHWALKFNLFVLYLMYYKIQSKYSVIRQHIAYTRCIRTQNLVSQFICEYNMCRKSEHQWTIHHYKSMAQLGYDGNRSKSPKGMDVSIHQMFPNIKLNSRQPMSWVISPAD